VVFARKVINGVFLEQVATYLASLVTDDGRDNTGKKRILEAEMCRACICAYRSVETVKNVQTSRHYQTYRLTGTC